MKDETRFKAGMHMLGTAFKTPITPEHLSLYWTALADLSDDEFARAVHVAVNEEEFWTPPARLRSLAQPVANFTAEAGQAYERVEKLGTYDPEGYRWSRAVVKRELGEAGLAAFDAIGGSAAWEDRSHVYRRKDFVETYVATRREEQREERLALTTGTGRRRLTTGKAR